MDESQESGSKYIHESHNVNNLVYHFVCPAKYRRIVFTEEVLLLYFCKLHGKIIDKILHKCNKYGRGYYVLFGI